MKNCFYLSLIFFALNCGSLIGQNCENDVLPPMIDCPSDQIVSTEEALCGTTLNLPADFSDNCGLVAFSDNISTGKFLEIFASGGGLDAPYGLVFGPDGNLYVSSHFNDLIIRYDGNTGEFIDVFASGGGLDSPVGLDFGPDGHLYVASFRGDQVLRYDGQTGAFIDIFASGSHMDGPTGLSFGPDGMLYLYVASATSDKILRYNGTTGAFVDVFSSGGGLDGPIGLEFGRDGNLFVSSYFSDQVLRYDGNTGAFIDIFTSQSEVDIPYGIEFGPDNNLYVANFLGDQILKYDGQSGDLIEVFIEGPELDGPLGILFDGNGHLYVSSRETDEVLRYNSSTGAFIDVFASGGGLDGPYGLTFGPDGHLYVASRYNDQVIKYNGQTGAFIEVFSSGGSLDFPVGLAFGEDENLYVSSFYSDQVLRYDGITGDFIDVFAEGNGLVGPSGLLFDNDGNLLLFVASATTDKILKYDGESGAFMGEFAMGGGLDGPIGMAISPLDNHLYVSSYYSDQVIRYNGQTGAFIDVFTSEGEVDIPYGISFGPDGNLYVASYLGDQILKYNGATGVLMEVYAEGNGLDGPLGITFGPDNNLYVSSRETDEVIKFEGPQINFFSVGVSELTYTANDEANNTATCSFMVTVIDEESPMLTCPTDVEVNTPEGICETAAIYEAEAMDNCGMSELDYEIASGSMFSVGSTEVGVTATDDSGNTATCSFMVTVIDEESPMLTCPTDVEVNTPEGICETAAIYEAEAMDNCGMSELDYEIASGSMFSVGSTEVGVTATDDSGNTATCSFMVTVIDEESPMLTCPTDVEVNTPEGICETAVTYEAEAMDNCGMSELDYEIVSGSMFSVGSTVVGVTATDDSGNTATCSFMVTVTDNELPTAECPNLEVNFNGETTIIVAEESLTGEVIANDNCGITDIFIDDLIEIHCDQIGEILEIPVFIIDNSGNVGECLSEVSVSGLPCGWENNGPIGNCGTENEILYDDQTEGFSVTSDGCVSTFPYTSDNQNLVSVELCGDGYIEVFVDNIIGKGFAGISLRESQASDAKKVEIGTDNVARIIRAARVIDGYPAFPQELISFDKFWLKIERTGNTFRASASTDGVSYTPYLFQSIMMGECLEAGMWAYSTNGADVVTATFNNVTVDEYNSTNLQASETNLAQSQTDLNTLDISLTPNPAKDQVSLNLDQLIGEAASISIFNINGQLMNSIQYDSVEDATATIDISNLPAGTYYVNVKTTAIQQTLKLIKQ